MLSLKDPENRFFDPTGDFFKSAVRMVRATSTCGVVECLKDVKLFALQRV